MTNMQNPAQQAAWPGAAMPPIRTYLVPAILVTLFCCLPTGLVAIIYASQVSPKMNVGDYHGAIHASRLARLWTIISVVIVVAAAVAGAVLAFVLVASSSSVSPS
jgi:ABC-type transporter Mla maintaining outer membrane lipid asymmetry permease subunit MlaE